jgi:hypothetical protein
VPSSFFQGVYFGLVIVASFVRVIYTTQYRKTAIAEDHRTVADALLTSLPGLGMFVLPRTPPLVPTTLPLVPRTQRITTKNND